MPDFEQHRLNKRFIAFRIVHVGEHEVLPDQYAMLVAGIVEVVFLIDHAAGHPQHVHAGSAGLCNGGQAGFRGSPQADGIQRRPAGTTAENFDAIDMQDKIAIGGIQRYCAKANPAAGHHRLGNAARHANPQCQVVKRRFAVGMGPPKGNLRQAHLAFMRAARPCLAEAMPVKPAMAFQLEPDRFNCIAVAGGKRQLAFDNPGRAVNHGFNMQAGHLNDFAVFQPNIPPGPHHSSRRGPAGCASQQGSAVPAQLLMCKHGRAPARTHAARRKWHIKCAEMDQQLVVLTHQGCVHIAFMPDKHIAARQQRGAIEPHLNQRCQSIETQHIALTRQHSRSVKKHFVPPVLRVKLHWGPVKRPQCVFP